MPHYYNDMYDYDYPPPGFNEDEGEQDYEYPELTPSECDRLLLRNVPSCSSIEDTQQRGRGGRCGDMRASTRECSAPTLGPADTVAIRSRHTAPLSRFH